MIKKILKINNKEAMIYFTDRRPFGVYCGQGQVMSVVDELLCPPNNAGCSTLSQYNKMLVTSKEDTQVIALEEITQTQELDLNEVA